MLKTGICSLEDLQRAAEDPDFIKGFWGGKRLPTVSIYDQAVRESESHAQMVLERFADSNGVYKRTYQNRFDEFDSKIVECVSDKISRDKSIRVHDLAVSDGRTACDFFRCIASQYSDIKFIASDYQTTLKVVTYKNVTGVFSAENVLVEIMRPPFVHSLKRTENFLFYPLNYIHRFIILKYAMSKLEKKLSRNSDIREIKLLCKRASDLVESDPRFSVELHSILEPAPVGEFHVVRAMNILNESYFSPEQMRQIVQHLNASLVDDGILAVGSNESAASAVAGAVYVKSAGSFELLWQSPDGLPVSHEYMVEKNG